MLKRKRKSIKRDRKRDKGRKMEKKEGAAEAGS